MTAKRRKRAQDDWRECPTAWFSMLEMALQERDYARAAAAQKELKRLKVEVRFLELPPMPVKHEGGKANSCPTDEEILAEEGAM
jgi:hypothetical protein